MMAVNIGFLHLLLFFSGLAGLGYEMLWVRMLAASLGHEIPSTLAVVSAFFAGLGLGAWMLDDPIRRSLHPARWYAALETAVGAWSLVLVLLIPAIGPWVATYIGIEPNPGWQWSICFAFPLVLLLPATFAMGATLPAAERLVSLAWRHRRAVGGLYAANTFGAVAGIGLTTFLLAPVLGYGKTGMLLAVLNLACAAGALGLGVRAVVRGDDAAPPPPAACSRLRLGGTLFMTGLLGIGYEVLVVRVASQVLENTVYSFACVLAGYLFGTAAGAAAYQRFGPKERFREILSTLLTATSALMLLGVFALWQAEPVYRTVRATAGGDMLGSLLGEGAVSAAVLLLPTAAMGAVFSHLAQEAIHNGLGLGRALAVNTLGGAIAPALFGVFLLPATGSVVAFTVTALAYPLLAPLTGRTAWLGAAVPAGLAVLVLLALSPRQLVELAPGEKILAHEEGVMAAVTVAEDDRHHRHLRVNSRFQMGGTSTAYSDRREAHIPLLLHPAPRTALFLGLGTGMTFAAATDHPGLEAEGVELVPEIVSLMPYFLPDGVMGAGQGRLHVRTADARRYVQATDRRYDVIVADLFHPSRDGAGSLYTLEHFRAIRERLRPGGLFVQWLPLYQLHLGTLRTIMRTYLKVFPEARALLAHYSVKMPIVGLAGSTGPMEYSRNWLARRVQDSSLAGEIASLRLGSDFELFGSFLADGSELTHFAGDGPINTDDRPVVTFEAPRFAYGHPEPAAHRLLALIDAFSPRPKFPFENPDTEETLSMQRRLTAYMEARNEFVRNGAGIEETADVRELERTVRQPLLAILRISPDFSAAYNPLLAIAYRLHRTNPDIAWSLLRDLEDVVPGRDEARKLKGQLFGGSSDESALPRRGTFRANPLVRP